MEIIACKEETQKYGFDISDENIKSIKKFLEKIYM